MAGPIQVGDIIKFTELAWTVWQYGWAAEYDASDNYRSFGIDVQTLHGSLKALEDVVAQAQTSLLNHGAQSRDILGGDKVSLSEIIGDYEATLRNCYRLLEKNRRYAQTTGPMRNIDWNLNIMPQVDHLRREINMHNIRIQNVIKPFEIDLITKFHGDLVQRITGLHTDVLCIKRHISALIAEKYPEVAKALTQQAEQELYSVRIPDSVLVRLQGMLEHCHDDGSGRSLTLQEMADCFLVHFNKSTVQCQSAPHGSKTCPPVAHYIELLKCQLLMYRMKTTNELQNPPRMSHWPGYIGALEEKLSQECARFRTELTAPDTSNCEDGQLAFWPEDEPITSPPEPISSSAYSSVLEVPLAIEPGSATWKTMQLLRAKHSDRRFRIIESWGYDNESSAQEPKVVNFNTDTAALIPIYADPVGERGSPPPLEVVLEENHVSHQYVFLDIKHVLLFQQALTGFKVAADYMQSHAVAMFIRPGQQKSVKEDVTVQLWLPSCIKEQSETAGGNTNRTPSITSQETALLNASHARRPSSLFSSRSATGMSVMSYSSSGSEDTVGFNAAGRYAGISHGWIRPRIRNPLLVLFTRCCETSRRSIVAITIDDETKPTPERCNCLDFQDCRITALEQRHGRSLRAHRLENRAKWDLLPLLSAPSWNELRRVSILFPTPETRFRFGGGYCECQLLTDGDVDGCLSSQHQGLLGIVRAYHRRQMVLWQEHKDGQKQVDVK